MMMALGLGIGKSLLESPGWKYFNHLNSLSLVGTAADWRDECYTVGPKR
jgi:hypothetical protein